MDRERVVELYEERPSHLWSSVRSEDPETYQAIDKQFAGDTFTERAYQYVHGAACRRCERCGAACAFNGFGDGFSRFCGRACANTARSERKNGRACLHCGGVFTSTTRNDVPAHAVCCSAACYDAWTFTPGADDLNAARRALQGSDNPSQDLRAHDPALYAYAVREEEGDTDSERIYRALRDYDDTCAVCEARTSFRSWSAGFSKYCGRACASAWQAARRVTRSYTSLVGGQRSGGCTPLFDVSSFDGMSGEYPFRCEACGHVFKARLDNGNVPVCRACHPVSASQETYEGQLASLVEEAVDGTVLRNDRSLLDGRELDVYVPSMNVAFEMNGLYWHSEAAGGKGRSYHLGKTRACEAEGVQLVHVWGCDWRDRRPIVASRVRHALGVTDRSVGARQCQVREITPPDKNRFMERSHLQGACRSTVKLGLVADGGIVAAMTFSRARAALSQQRGWEIARYCTRPGLAVHGGASRLFSRFVDAHDPETVTSFADRAWSSPLSRAVYDHMGFEQEGTTAPGYWYTRSYKRRMHRYGFRKSELSERLDVFDPALSEWQNMRANGWDRVWDCGSIRYRIHLR